MERSNFDGSSNHLQHDCYLSVHVLPDCYAEQVKFVWLDFRALAEGVLFWMSSKVSLNSSFLWFCVAIWFYLVFGFLGGQTELVVAPQLIFNISAFDPASCLMKGNDFLGCYALKMEQSPCSCKQWTHGFCCWFCSVSSETGMELASTELGLHFLCVLLPTEWIMVLF